MKPCRLDLNALLLTLLLVGCTDIKRYAYEGINRDEWQKPKEVIRALGIRPGDHVADLGSGGGYFTFRFANAVGAPGRVYAVDVDKGLNEDLQRRAREDGFTNIQVILAMHDDPLLPEAQLDLIFLTNVYHHLDERARYFANVKKYLKPNGRVAIIDFKSAQWFQVFGGHYTPSDVVKKEMTQAGYGLQQEFDFLPRQHFLVFARRK